MFLTLPSAPSLPAEATTTIVRVHRVVDRLLQVGVGVERLGGVLGDVDDVGPAWRPRGRWRWPGWRPCRCPSSSFCRIGMIVGVGGDADEAGALEGRAAMMPATLVPWPTVSFVPSPCLAAYAGVGRRFGYVHGGRQLGVLVVDAGVDDGDADALAPLVSCHSWLSRMRCRDQGVPLMTLPPNVHCSPPSRRLTERSAATAGAAPPRSSASTQTAEAEATAGRRRRPLAVLP